MFGAYNYYKKMVKDISYDSIPPDCYIHSQDIRISTSEGESNMSWSNIKGNKQSFSIPQDGATGVAEIIGYTVIRDKIILFVADDSNSNGWIYLVKYDPSNRNILTGYPQELYFNANLNLSKEWPIEAIGRYENENIQRVEFTDYNNFLRSINIADPNLSTLPVGQIDIYPNIEYTQPRLKFISGGGAILGGVLQAAYRLITSDGKQTLISPPSNLIHIVSDSENLIQSAQYTGDISSIDTGKSITIEIDTTNYSDFDKIELIIVRHTNLTGTPEVFAVEQLSINGASTVEFTYTGTETTVPIELLEYTTKSFAFKTCKTLAQKDSSLVVSNIKGSSVSIQELLGAGETFDTKTYRYNSLGVTNNDEFNQNYNSDAHWNPDWHTNSQYKYQSDGVTLGGEGVNISYKFYLEPFTVDGDSQEGFANVGPFPDATHNLNDNYTYYNTSYPNNPSPFISGLLRGYKRGETYRFGVIVFTTKGETSFVEFIGDIKFPDISEEDGSPNSSGTNYWPLSQQTDTNITTAYSLGIEFTIDFSTAPSLLAQIESYQIVRVKREEEDKRRVSQGIVKTFWFAPIASPGSGIDFDLRVDGDSNVVHLMPYYPTGELNATFNTLEDQENAATPVTPVYLDYLIKGQYLGFYSPDISYNLNNVRNSGTNLNNNPAILITGAYGDYARSLFNVTDLTSENLAQECQDWRDKSRNIHPVSFNSVENIKQWKFNTLMSMESTSVYINKITSDYSGYFMRNYYAIDDFGDSSSHLNDPQGTGPSSGTSETPEFFRGGTSIIGEIQSFSTDPLTGDPVAGGITSWFDAPTNIQVLDINTGAANPAVYPSSTPIVDLVLPKNEIYGGFNQDALEGNIFIPASPVIDKTNLNPVVFGGDTFLNMFTLQTAMLDLSEEFYELSLGNFVAYARDNSYTELYVTESNINIDLDHGSTLKRGVTYKVGAFEATVLRQEDSNFSTANGKTLRMYDYNTVYSKENNDVTFFIQPSSLSSLSIVNDIRSYLSDTKINGETIDSWTKFGVNNFYDVDDYGPINKILNWKDSVFFYQDKAVGVFAINRAAITTTTDGVPTELGTGQGFGKHQYISKEKGCIHQWGVKATDKGVYSFDAIRRKICVLVGQEEDLSDLKGVHSWVNNLPDAVFLRKENGGDNPILNRGVTFGYDKINDELIFTFLGSGYFRTFQTLTSYLPNDRVYSPVDGLYYLVHTAFSSGADLEAANTTLILRSTLLSDDLFRNESIAYDELEQSFFTHPSITPPIFIENGDILITPNPSQRDELYTHNIGNWGEFYSQVVEASITLIINPKSDINKILRTFEYNSIVRDNNKVIDRTQTITGFRIQTEYQDSGKIPFSSGRIKRRFDKWRVKLPKDKNNGRFRSTYFILTLYFDNILNKQIIVNKLLSYHDPQIF
jgi:hypothetical protein